jgi:hypothetical protein
MSQPAPCGRATPRWSAMTRFPNASVQAFTGMASIAVLPASSAMVWVGPPLFAREKHIRAFSFCQYLT